MNASVENLKVLAAILEHPIHAQELANAIYDMLADEGLSNIILENPNLEITCK